MTKTGRCLLTGNQGTFVKCHLIPKALFPERRGTKVVHSDARTRPKRRPVGAYDEALVIRHGEDILSRYDDYGIRFLRRQAGTWRVSADMSSWLVDDFDYELLKLFYLSLLWRCAVTSHFGDELIDVNDRLDDLREMVLRGDPGNAGVFSVLSQAVDYDPKLVPVFPFTTRLEDGRKDHCALIGGYVIYITENWEDDVTLGGANILTRNQTWQIPKIDWMSSGYANIAKRTLDENDERWPGWMTNKDVT